MARILIADDDQIARDFVRQALEADNHSVTTADDGAEALAKLSAGAPFDLLLTDVQMPGMDGVALTREAQKRFGHLRVVLMSGYADVLTKAQSDLASSVAFIAKPFSLHAIRDTVARILKP